MVRLELVSNRIIAARSPFHIGSKSRQKKKKAIFVKKNLGQSLVFEKIRSRADPI